MDASYYIMNVVAQVEQFRSLVINFMISMFFCGCINEQLFTVNLVCLVLCLFMSIKLKPSGYIKKFEL